jgi:hypothetical protein
MATFLIALVCGGIGLVAGFFAGAFVGAGIAAATHMSTFEGAAGYFAVFVCGPIGALIGLVVGVWLALRMRGVKRGIGVVATYSVTSLVAIIAVSAAVIWLMLTFDTTLNRNSAPRQVLFEIRMPPGTKLAADRSGTEIELNTDRNSATAYKSKEEYQYDDGDRPVISGGVEIAFRTSSRIIVLKSKGEPDRLFRLDLAPNPSHSDAFGPWQPIDWIAESNAQQPRKATPDDKYEIRYRVRDPNVEFSRPIIAFELSLPAGTPLPDDVKTIKVVALEAANDMDGSINAESIKHDGDRVTLSGTVQIAGETHSLIAVSIPNQPTRLFEIKLPPLTWITETIRYATSSPANDTRTFGPWQDVGFIREPGNTEPRPAKPEDDAKFHYMLR